MRPAASPPLLLSPLRMVLPRTPITPVFFICPFTPFPDARIRLAWNGLTISNAGRDRQRTEIYGRTSFYKRFQNCAFWPSLIFRGPINILFGRKKALSGRHLRIKACSMLLFVGVVCVLVNLDVPVELQLLQTVHVIFPVGGRILHARNKLNQISSDIIVDRRF